jgi:Ser/Thr protein kinase RdoA (MazF antagonist)
MPSDPEAYAVIHSDFEPDNLLWDGERWQVPDCDGAAYVWYGVDIGSAVADLWRADPEQRDRQRDGRLADLLEGYAQVRPMPSGMQEALPRRSAILTAWKV